MTDSPIGDAEGRLRDAVRRLENSGSIADGKAARDITAILARLETAEQTAADGWAAGYRAGGEDAKSMIRTLNGANAELEARLETAERENKRLEGMIASHKQIASGQINALNALRDRMDHLTALIRDTAIPALEPMRSAAMTLASQAGAARENNRRGASEWEPSRARRRHRHQGEDDVSELENALLAQALTNGDGSVRSPTCCGQKMADDGGCSEGCCDDFKCTTCGKRIRVAWPA